MALPALALLVFLVACGSGTNAGFGTSTIGNFTNASLKGNYTYSIAGWDLGTNTAVPFREAGVFTADGKGNITAGEDDYSEGTLLQEHTMVSGNYTIAKDGTGTVNLNFGNGGGLQVAVTVATASRVYLSVSVIGPQGTALFANGFGTADLQDTTAFSAAPSGTFVFRRHDITSAQTNSVSAVGIITVASGSVTGTEDINELGAINQRAISSGTFSTPDSQGRGTGSFTDSGGTRHFAYYVVNSSRVQFFTTDTGIGGLGEAEAQTGGPNFSNSSVSGSFAFGTDGDDSVLGLDDIKTVGRFSSDGNGNLSAGALDSNEQGNTTTNASFTGSYNVASDGRGTGTLTETGGSIPVIFYIVGPSRLYLLINDPTVVEDGTADAQQSSSFSNSSLNTQYAFFMDGFDTGGNLWDRVGWIHGDGSGRLTLSEFLNEDGNTNTSGLISGNYAVSSNGRVTGSITNLSGNLVFYLVSNSSGYVLQNDSGFQISGMMTKQQAP